MGITDKAKELRDKVAQSGKTDEFIDKAREKADKATGGRFGEAMDKGAQKAKGMAGKRPEEQAGSPPDRE